MSLLPFHLAYPAGPLDPVRIERFLADWVVETHGPTGAVVRWAVVDGPERGAVGPWRIEGVAGPLTHKEGGV